MLKLLVTVHMMIGLSSGQSGCQGESFTSPADPTLLSQSSDSERNDPEPSSVDSESSTMLSISDLTGGHDTDQLSVAGTSEPMQSNFVNDSGCAQSLNSCEQLSALQDHFKPNKLLNFPTHTEYRKKHSFRYCWLEHDWLVYSPSQVGAWYVFFLKVIEVTKIHPNLTN